MSDQIDILNNGELVKTTIVKGLGRETRPHRGDVVAIVYSAKLEDGTEIIPETDEFITIGDCDIIDAIDLSLPFCDLKEKYSIKAASRFCYGSIGLEPSIPPNSTLIIEVELLRSSEPPVYELMEAEKRINISDKKRERGNFYYRRKEFQYALTVYDKAVSILVNDQEMATPDVMDLILKLWNNIAACNLKLENYSSTIEYCKMIIKENPENFKAVYRLGRAHLLLGEPKLALESFNRLLEIDPESQLAQAELNRAKKEISDQQDRIKKAMKTYFSKKNAEYIKDFENIIPENLYTKRRWLSYEIILISTLVLILSILVCYFYFGRGSSNLESTLQTEEILTKLQNDFSQEDPKIVTIVDKKEEFDEIMHKNS